MNRTRTIALFAGIFAIAMTTYGLTGVSASPMIMSSIIPQTQDVSILGHAEFTVFDSDNNIKSYTQVDNVVVFTGKDCAGALIFGAVDGLANSACAQTSQVFDYIAIGNGTVAADADGADTTLSFTGNGCAEFGASQEGELARKQVSPQVDVIAAIGIGTDIVLDVGSDTFKFTLQNTTTTQTITQSGIFNGNNGVVDGECDTFNAANWDMFAIRDISVTVSSGDSLAVKWTISLD